MVMYNNELVKLMKISVSAKDKTEPQDIYMLTLAR